MRAIIKIISTVAVSILGLMSIFLMGEKRGKEREEARQIKDDNKNLAEVNENVQKINKNDADIDKLSPSELIDGLRKYTQD